MCEMIGESGVARYNGASRAGVAQSVERLLPKQKVAPNDLFILHRRARDPGAQRRVIDVGHSRWDSPASSSAKAIAPRVRFMVSQHPGRQIHPTAPGLLLR